MLIISEKLNSSSAAVRQAIEQGDEALLCGMIKAAEAAGAAFIDINTAAASRDELESLVCVAKLVVNNSGCSLSLDSDKPEVLCRAVAELERSGIARGRNIIINSVGLGERFDRLISVCADYRLKVIVLPMDSFVPQTAEERAANAGQIMQKLVRAGADERNILIDALIEPISVRPRAAVTTLDTIRLLSECFPLCGCVCGISNISYGMPTRYKLNAAFLAMCCQAGLGAVIADPCAAPVADTLAALRALTGEDEYGIDFIHANRP